MKEIHYTDDFLLIERFCDAGGAAVPVPTWNWQIEYFTSNNQIKYIASHINGVWKHCMQVGESMIIVSFDRHNLGKGEIQRVFAPDLDNLLFADGAQNVYLRSATGYYLVESPTTAEGVTIDKLDSITGLDATLIMPYIRGPKGDQGDTGEQGPKGDKGDQGEKGDTAHVMFATFDIDPATGELSVTTPDGYNGAQFSIENDILIVEI